MPGYAELATPETFEWLLAGDPSIRWQVYGDLLSTGFLADHGIDFNNAAKANTVRVLRVLKWWDAA